MQDSISGCVNIGYAAGYDNTTSNRLYIDNGSTISPLIGGHFDNNMVGINTDIGSIARTMHVTGEMRDHLTNRDHQQDWSVLMMMETLER
ncbi:MAG: hypothetical protein IPG18_00900 [Saprospiraceae bacterium]|nr:hypothetical protein [Saprospiraceae bacterium]